METDRYYKILKINKGASKEEIEEAYIKRLKKYPPEKEPEQFRKTRRAYEILTNQYHLNIYDKKLKIKCKHCGHLYKVPKSLGKIQVICANCEREYIINTDI